MNRRNFIKGLGYGGAALGANWNLAAIASASSASIPGLKSFIFDTVTVDHRGKEVERHQHRASYFSQDLGSDSGNELQMVAIPGSQFLMGASRFEVKGGSYESFLHQVAVKPSFMSQTPVTQQQWLAVSQLPKIRRDLLAKPAYFGGHDNPVESVSWLDAVEFCQRLSKHTGKNYGLPSEALWESACRAGTATPFNFGNTVTSEHANYSASHTYASEKPSLAQRTTTAVAKHLPNAYGLYDMHGNVWEWCADTWHENYRGAPNDGRSWVSGGNLERRVVRGGSWADEPARLRSASRSGYRADFLNRVIGFRVSIESV